MVRSEWLAGALAVLAIGFVAFGDSGERAALKMVKRLGGKYEIERRFGLECLGVVVEVELAECAPTARDLVQLKNFRHLRVLDLSRTPIGDRELLQLVDSRCPCIVVPNGQTSETVRNMFDEHQLAVGLGFSEITAPSPSASIPRTVTANLRNVRRAGDSRPGKQEPPAKHAPGRWPKGYGG